MMNFYNRWKRSHLIKWDKFNLTLKVGKMTLVRIDLNISERDFHFNILNFGFKNK